MRLLALYLLVHSVFTESDYYKILGVDKDADDRTIRRAFKKLAVQKHPDKNKDNPDAHAEFLKINRAYEVLKDEELRKKYDQYGEKGLEDGFDGGNTYQSWQFYNDNFGIYDEDPEIVTLNRADFQRLVTDSPQDMWFINFYSTYCSHCHQLAPTWRKFAREIEGTIRIGAVNCAEDVHLCQSQRVNAYPSLVFYPTGEFYQGHREVEYLTDFVMQRLQSEVLHLDRGNIDSLSKEFEPYNKRAWVIDFCDEMEACMSSINRRKLAAMLDKLANVGTIDCISRKKLCTRLGHSEGAYYYPAGQIDEENGRALESLDPQEIVTKVISFLPNLEAVEDNELEQLFGSEGVQQPTAVWFVPNGKAVESRPEYKKLPTTIDDIRIVYADCAEFTEICTQHLDVSKLPQFVVFKTSGGYEIDYVNKPGLYDVVAFIREAAVSPLHILDDVAYNSAVNSGELWIVDYFAPWCPPCLKLIGEYRRLHAHIAADSNMANLKIGTIDCQKYAQICSHNGVQSYPTSILYAPEGKTHRIVGYHHQHQIIEFVDNALNPSVQELNEIDFETYVLNKRDDETWIVDFFAPWCGPCQQLAPEYQRAARSLKSHKEDKIIMASVDCQAHPQLCQSQKVNSYPTIRLYPAKGGKQKRSNSYDYPNHMWRNSDSIQRWVFGLLPSNVVTLGNDFWTTVLDSDTPWMVDFFAPWCGHCIQFAPTYERLAKILDGKVQFAKVDCDQWPGVCQGAQIRAYPTVRLYRGRKNYQRQDVWGLAIQAQNAEVIVEIIQQQFPELFVEHDEL